MNTKQKIIVIVIGFLLIISDKIFASDTIKPTINGTLPTIESIGCSINDATVAASTVNELEAMGLLISDNFSSKNKLTVNSFDTVSNTNSKLIIRTYIISDEANNFSTIDQQINIKDNQKPTVIGKLPFIQDIVGGSINLKPAPYNSISDLESLGLTIFDNCSVKSNIELKVIDTHTGNGPITVSRDYFILDESGNKTILNQTFTITGFINAKDDNIIAKANIGYSVLANNGFGADDLDGPVSIYQIYMNVVTEAVSKYVGAKVPQLNTNTGKIEVSSDVPNGDYTIVYKIIDVLNPDNQDTARVNITVVDNQATQNMRAQNVKVHNGMSPNGLEGNNYFNITGLEDYPNNKVSIYTNDGNLVYNQSNYTKENAFRTQQAGSYLYILTYIDNNDNVIEKTGYLYVIQ